MSSDDDGRDRVHATLARIREAGQAARARTEIERAAIANRDPNLGRLVCGKYRLERVMGQGGMGVVYAARNELLGRDVAIKFLHDHLARDHELATRFLREAQTAARLKHPNIIDVLDVDRDDRRTPFMVLELLDGETLASTLGRVQRLSVAEAFGALLPVMDVVALAHDAGVIHRDIKPANVFLHRDGSGTTVPKLLDFGLAKTRAPGASLTITGNVMGTPRYMPPEQMADSKRVTPASDVWSLGVVWCEALTGNFPHHLDPDEADTSFWFRVMTQPARSLGTLASELPADIVHVVDRALEIVPAARWRNAAEFAGALRAAAPAIVPAQLEIAPGALATESTAVSPHERTMAAPVAPRK